jgi:hypothetical protein
VLRRKKDFGNPCILDKVIQHYGIDHIGGCSCLGWVSVAARRGDMPHGWQHTGPWGLPLSVGCDPGRGVSGRHTHTTSVAVTSPATARPHPPAGTAHAPAVLDPHGYAPCEYYRALAEAQRRAEEERAARQSSAVRSSIAFAAESAATAGAVAGGAGAAFHYASAPVLSGSRHLGTATVTTVAATSFAPSAVPPGTAVPATSTAGADSTLNLAVARARAAALTVAAGAGAAQDRSSSGRMPSKWDR